MSKLLLLAVSLVFISGHSHADEKNERKAEQNRTPSKTDFNYKARSFTETNWAGTLDNIRWACSSHNCYGLFDTRNPDKDPSTLMDECGKLSYKVGGLADFQPNTKYAGPMVEQTLAKCNSGVKIGAYRKYYYTANLAKPAPAQHNTVIDKKYGITWKCLRTQCWAFIDQTSPSWHHCKELNRKLGRITDFFQTSTTYGQKFLQPGLLYKCNF